jgi:hypothetical protein
MLRDKLWRRDQTDSSETRDQRPKFSRLRIDARSPDTRGDGNIYAGTICVWSIYRKAVPSLFTSERLLD